MRAISGIPTTLALAGLLLGCSTASTDVPEPRPARSRIEQLNDKFEGQLVAILAFDEKNPACRADPGAMDPATLAACTPLERLQLRDEFTVTPDVDGFDPRTRTMLVIDGAGVDSSHPDVPWYAVVGLGPLPAGPSGLVTTTTSLEPQIAPAIPLVVVGVELLIEAAIVFFAAKAVVATTDAIMKSQDAREPAAGVRSKLVEGTSPLLPPDCNENNVGKTAKHYECSGSTPGRQGVHKCTKVGKSYEWKLVELQNWCERRGYTGWGPAH
jgi:hypothetical protein